MATYSVLASTSTNSLVTSSSGLAIDSLGNVYCSNYDTNQILKINSVGDVSTFASDSKIQGPLSLLFDASGTTLYCVCINNNSIVKIDTLGTVRSFASGLNSPTGLAFDNVGNLYSTNRINSTIDIIDADGSANPFASGLNTPAGIIFHPDGFLVVANYSNRILSKVTTSGDVTTYFNGSGLFAPEGLAIDSFGNIYIGNAADSTDANPGYVSIINDSIIDSSGVSINYIPSYPGFSPQCVLVSNQPSTLNNLYFTSYRDTQTISTVYVSHMNSYSQFNDVSSNVLTNVSGMTFDLSGNYLYMINNNNSIVKFDTAGNLSTFVSTIASGCQGQYLIFDKNGYLYCSDYVNNKIYQINPSGTVSTYADNNNLSSDASLSGPTGLVFDSSGILYCSNFNTDANNIVQIDGSGVITPFASGLDGPEALVFDSNGMLYCANYSGNTISQIDVSTKGVTEFASGLNNPTGLVFDDYGNLYCTNFGLSTMSIVQIDASGVVTQFTTPSSVSINYARDITIKNNILYFNGYNPGIVYVANNAINAANNFNTLIDISLNKVLGLTYDTSGNIYCSNTFLNSTSGTGSITVYDSLGNYKYTMQQYSGQSSVLNSPHGLAFDASGYLYCANAGGNDILRITIYGDNSYNVISYISINPNYNYPTDVAIFNNYLYVVGFNGNGSYVIQIELTSSPSIINDDIDPSYGLLDTPLGVACDASGNVYVSNPGLRNYGSVSVTNTIGKFDASLNPITYYSYPLLNTPQGLAFNQAGNLMIANTKGYNILQLDTNTGDFSLFADVGYVSSVLAVDKSNYLYVANTTYPNGTVYKTIEPILSFTALINDISLNGVLGITYDTSGNIYCSNSYTNTITVYNSSGSLINTISVDSQGTNPHGLVFDNSGYLYCALSNANLILKIDTNDISVNTFINLTNLGYSYPTDVAIFNNYLYVVGFTNTTSYILKFNLATPSTIDASYSTNDSSYDLSTPLGVVCDASGNVYTSNIGLYTNLSINTIGKFDASLNPLTYYSSPLLNTPHGLAFNQAGNLMIANAKGFNILQLDTNRSNFSVLADVGYLSSVLAVNESNYLYIADYRQNYGVIYTTDEPVCFNHDTKILCLNYLFEEEYIPIQDLKKGDFVKTYLHGYRKIEYMYQSFMGNNPNKWNHCMYKMEKTEENGLLEDLILTGGHSIMVDSISEVEQERYNKLGLSNFAKENKVDEKYLLLASVSEQFIPLTDTNIYTIYHFCLENNGDDTTRYGVWANGILTETPSKQYLVQRDIWHD